MMRSGLILILSALHTGVSYAYLDPASGNAVASFFIAVFGSIAFFFKSLYYRLFSRSPKSVLSRATVDKSSTTPLLFSEGKTYWSTFRPIVEELIKRKIHFRYVTLDIHDPALRIDCKFMHSKRFSRNKLGFAKIAMLEAPVMLSTTPNIGSEGYPMERPAGVKNLVHVFHALVDLSCYRKGSLDFYDSVLMAGEHEAEPIRLVESARGLTPKELIVAGLPCLDDLHRQKTELNTVFESEQEALTTVLVAPSWGSKGCFSEYGTSFVQALSESGFKVIIRLHPHSIIYEPESVSIWREETADLQNVVWDDEIFGVSAMSQADILISDASSIRFDFAFLFEKPVVSLEIPPQSRSMYESDYMNTSWADSMVEQIGVFVPSERIGELTEIVDETLSTVKGHDLQLLRDKYVANFRTSPRVIVKYLEDQAQLLSLTPEQLTIRKKFEELENQIETLTKQVKSLDTDAV